MAVFEEFYHRLFLHKSVMMLRGYRKDAIRHRSSQGISRMLMHKRNRINND